MRQGSSVLAGLAPDDCICFLNNEEHCVCSAAERALRYVASGHAFFEPAQRRWCLGEVERAGVHGLHEATDLKIARALLDHWNDPS